MTLTDPFATAPAPDEAQVPGINQTLPVAVVEPVKAAPKKGCAPTQSEGKITVTFKGGSGYDAPWIVVHAADLQDALDQVSGENAFVLANLMTEVQKAGGYFAGLYPTKAPVKAGTGSAPAAAAPSPSAPPPGATSAPNGETRQCQHGEMTYKTGFSAKTNKTWQAFMCPTPKGTPGQCEAEWIR